MWINLKLLAWLRYFFCPDLAFLKPVFDPDSAAGVNFFLLYLSSLTPNSSRLSDSCDKRLQVAGIKPKTSANHLTSEFADNKQF